MNTTNTHSNPDYEGFTDQEITNIELNRDYMRTHSVEEISERFGFDLEYAKVFKEQVELDHQRLEEYDHKTFNIDETNIETTTNTTALLRKITDRSQHFADNPKEYMSLKFSDFNDNDIYDDDDEFTNKYLVQNMYAAVRMIQIHDMLISDQYDDDQKREAIRPFVDDVDEELNFMIEVSKTVDLIKILVVPEESYSDITYSRGSHYMLMLRECADLMLDEELDKAREETGFNKLVADNAKRIQLQREDSDLFMKMRLAENDGFQKLKAVVVEDGESEFNRDFILTHSVEEISERFNFDLECAKVFKDQVDKDRIIEWFSAKEEWDDKNEVLLDQMLSSDKSEEFVKVIEEMMTVCGEYEELVIDGSKNILEEYEDLLPECEELIYKMDDLIFEVTQPDFYSAMKSIGFTLQKSKKLGAEDWSNRSMAIEHKNYFLKQEGVK